MAIDEVPEREHQSTFATTPPQSSTHSGILVAVFVILAALAVGEVYTLSQIGSVRDSIASQQTKLVKDQQVVTNRVSTLEQSDAQSHEALKTQIEASQKRVGSTGGEVRRARAKVAELENEYNAQKQQSEALKAEIAKKADQEQLGVITQDVSATKTDLDGTKKSLDSLRSDLGMAKSELGTLIARNHDDVETLRKLGERDYFEFTLDRKQPKKVAGVGLTLKKTNVKAHKFSIVLQADDMAIEKKDRTVNEPIFILVGGSKKPYELVVNKVQSDRVIGYLSAPKGSVEVAERSGGAQ